jgi:general secretion pathway protein H
MKSPARCARGTITATSIPGSSPNNPRPTRGWSAARSASNPRRTTPFGSVNARSNNAWPAGSRCKSCPAASSCVPSADVARVSPGGLGPSGVDPNSVNPRGADPRGFDLGGLGPRGDDPRGVNPKGRDATGDDLPDPSAGDAKRSAKARQGGFTLIEMIVVITILAMVAGLIVTRQPWRSVGLNTDATVRALTNGLRLARSRAIAQDRDVVVVAAARGFSIDGGPAWTLPEEETFSRSQVVFTPDGGSSGGTILLAAGQRRIAVDVNWLTGRVRWHEIATQ